MTSSQQRARYCYLALSIWIFFLMAATYKYLGSNDTATSNSINNNYKLSINNQNSISRDFSRNSNFRNKRIFSVCNDPENINYGSEGAIVSQYVFQDCYVNCLYIFRFINIFTVAVKRSDCINSTWGSWSFSTY